MTCKDCIHDGVCYMQEVVTDIDEQLSEFGCEDYKNKSDYAEVKHGEWIYHECVSSYDGAISGYSCSECSAFVDEEMFDSDEFHKDYCGCCGAKIDGRSDT